MTDNPAFSPARQTHLSKRAHLSHDKEGGFVASDPKTGTTTQGETRQAALANLREAVELYLEEFPDQATD